MAVGRRVVVRRYDCQQHRQLTGSDVASLPAGRVCFAPYAAWSAPAAVAPCLCPHTHSRSHSLPHLCHSAPPRTPATPRRPSALAVAVGAHHVLTGTSSYINIALTDPLQRLGLQVRAAAHAHTHAHGPSCFLPWGTPTACFLPL